MQKNSFKIFIILVVCMLVRELLLFDFSLYQQKSSWDTSSKNNFSSKTLSTDKDLLTKNSPYPNLDNGDFPQVIFQTFGDTISNVNEHYIFVNINKQFSQKLAYYIPLIKPIKFNYDLSYSWNSSFTKGNKRIHGNSSTEFKIDGKSTIYGFCSAKTARQLIEGIVEQEIREKAIEEINQHLTSVIEN